MLARLYQAGRLQLDEMVTKRYRLDDINNDTVTTPPSGGVTGAAPSGRRHRPRAPNHPQVQRYWRCPVESRQACRF